MSTAAVSGISGAPRWPTRTRPASHSRRCLQPLLANRGITRVADLTDLDHLGVPVFSAIRPTAATLTASAGKGIDADTAWTSAVMESLEVRAAEMYTPSVTARASAVQLKSALGYEVTNLDLHPLSLADSTTILDWTPACDLVTDAAAMVPAAAVGLLGWHDASWQPPLFVRTSNGLAAGNTADEALVHAMLELIERDAIAQSKSKSSTVLRNEEVCSWLEPRLQSLFDLGLWIRIELLASLPGTYASVCFLSAADMPQTFGGTGCDVTVPAAVQRAVLEAAQSRLSVISGLRDDIRSAVYAPSGWPISKYQPAEAISLAEAGDSSPEDVTATRDWLVRAISSATGAPVLACDLTVAGEPFPEIYQVFAPGLRGAPRAPKPTRPKWTRG